MDQFNGNLPNDEEKEINKEVADTDASGISADAQNGISEEKKPNATLISLIDFIEIFTLSIVAVLMVFTFSFRLCRVDGESMEKTLSNDEMLITTNLFYTPQANDIVVFHLSNNNYQQPLVKRVIATEGQTVKIDFTAGKVFVDGKEIDDSHAYVEGGRYNVRYGFNQNYMHNVDDTIYFEAVVPEGTIFVMGDNRNNSSDSRFTSVGFVDLDCVLGRAIIRVSPFTLID